MKKRTWILTPGERQGSDAQKRKRIMIESPLAGDTANNVAYAKYCMADAFKNRGEAPMAFHLLYTQSLCDDNGAERKLGIDNSFVWHEVAEKKVFCIDYGFSQGMLLGYLDSIKKGIEVEFRSNLGSSEILKWSEFLNKSARNGSVENELVEYRNNFINIKKTIVMNNELKKYLDPDKSNHVKNTLLIEYARHAMRDSMVRCGKAPFSSILIKDSIGISDDSFSMDWHSKLSEIDIYIDLGITKEMNKICEEALNKGIQLNIMTASMDNDRKKVVDEINNNEDCQSKLEIAKNISKECFSSMDEIRINESIINLIKRVNDASYSSKEREFKV